MNKNLKTKLCDVVTWRMESMNREEWYLMLMRWWGWWRWGKLKMASFCRYVYFYFYYSHSVESLIWMQLLIASRWGSTGLGFFVFISIYRPPVTNLQFILLYKTITISFICFNKIENIYYCYYSFIRYIILN